MSRNKRLFLLVDAMEVAALGLRVESGQVGQAVDGLERLTGAAERAERSTDGLSKGAESARKSSDRLGKSADASAKSVTNLAQMASRAGVMLGAALSVTLLKDYADSWSDMQSQVGAAVKNMGAAPALMQRIVDIANASYSPLQQTAAIYAQNVSVLEELGRSAQEAADFTESLNHMLVITATKGQQAEAVQGALSRAMAVGKLSGMGLETVLASGGRVAEALAKELGTTTNGLRAMAAQGKITSDVIANAIVNSLQDVRKEADEMPATIGDAFQRIQTNLTEFVGVLDQATGSSGAIAQGLIGVADAIRTTSKYASTFAALAAPAFDMVGSAVSAVAGYADMAVVALAGFYAPAMMGGLSLLTTSLGVGLVGALRAVAAAMLANPIGLLVGALVTAGYAVYKFRDQIHEAIGVDVVQTAKTAANYIIGSFVAAYEDLKFVFGNFGSIVGGAIVGGVNVAIRAVNGLIQGVTSRLDSFVESINETFGTGMKMIGGSAAIQEMVNPYADAVAAALEERGKKISEALSRDYLGELAAGFKKATLVIGGSTETIKNNSRSLVDNSKKLTEAAKAAKKFAEERVAAFQKQREGISDLQKERRALEDQITTFGQSKRAIEQLTISRLREQAAVLAGFAGSEEAIELLRLEIEEREKLLQAGFTMDGLERGKKAAEELAEASKKTHDDIERSLTDALLRGFESGKGFGRNFIDTLKNMFSSLVLRPIIQPIAAGAAGMITGALGFGGTANAQGAGGGIDPLTGASMAQKFLSGGAAGPYGMSGGMSWFTGFGGNVSNLAADLGANLTMMDGAFSKLGSTLLNNAEIIGKVADVAGQAFGYGSAIYDLTKGNYGAAAGGAIGTYFGGPIGSFLGSQLGGMLDKAFKGETRAGGGFVYDPALKQASFHSGPSGGYGGKATEDAVTQLFGSTVDTINSVIRGVGANAEVAFFHGAFESSKKGRGGTFSGGDIRLADGSTAGFGGAKKGDGYGGKSGTAEEMFQNLQAEVHFAALEAWKTVGSEMPTMISDMLGGMDIRALSAEQADALVGQISGTVAVVTAFSDALTTLPFENLRALTFDLSATMLQAFGGIENAMAGLDSYFQNFYSEAEQLDWLSQQLGTAFDSIGLAMPDVTAGADAAKQAFRELVEAQDVNTEEGQRATAALYTMSGSFAELVVGMEGLEDAVGDSANILRERESLERQLLSAMGDTDALRALDLAALDESNRALQEHIWAVLDKAEADARAAEIQRGIEQERAGIERERYGLETQLLQLLGDTDALRARQLATLDESNHAIQREIWSLQDLAAAAQEAERAGTAAAAELKRIWDAAIAAGNTAYSALEKAIGAEREGIQREADRIAKALGDSISSASDAVRGLESLTGQLSSTVSSMMRSGLDDGRNREWAQERISRALSVATLTGVMPEGEDFESALQIVAEPSEGLFNSFEDYQLDFLRTAHEVDALRLLADDQLTTERRTLKTLEDQLAHSQSWYESEMARLDATLEHWRDQLDIAAGTYQATLSVGLAVAGVESAILGLSRALAPDDSAIPSFAVGTSYVPRDMLANIHAGEAVIDRSSMDVLRNYGIRVQGGGSDPETKALLRQIVQRLDRLEDIDRNTYDAAQSNRQMAESPQDVRVTNVVPVVEATPGQ